MLNGLKNYMTTTNQELLDLLKQEDEVLLLELLEISSEDLVNRFEDFIEIKYDKLIEEYGDTDE